MNKESKVIMKLIINKSLMVRLTFVMICLVAIVYGVYILDMPYSMYIFLQIIRILLFICVLISLIFTRVFIDKNTLSVMAFASFALIRSMLEDGDILHQILTIMTWPMIYTLFYSYTMVALKKTDEYTRETEKFKKILAAFIIVMAVVSIPLIQRNLSGQGRAGEVIFPVYFFLTAMSMVIMFFPKKNLFWVVPCIMIIFTTKRAGLLVIVCGLFLSQIAEYHMAKTLKKKWKKMLTIAAISVAAVIAMVFLVQTFNLNILQRFMGISEDGGSGRIQIWDRVYLSYSSGSIFERLFGQGYQSVTRLMLTGRAILAHNDYLEILHDYGIIGLVLFSIWLFQVLSNFVKMWYRRDRFLPSYCYTLSAMILLSILSYFFIQSYLINFTACYLGIVMALSTNNKKFNLSII